MTRRPTLPGASELFRSTGPAADPAPDRVVTGRERHATKITVYVSDEELLALEHARLALRGEHGLAVDRGRVVRAAIALALDDLDAHGGDSPLVRRLRDR
ncbi:hypothetical protein GCM10022243_17990 [Saccharothrix violaceirubra]|uniref:L-aminopeptidase/D-esterase-like protein n=1 Tax=Saccharothrix violaceirubra TaxID=413306 RepID=A0A7W7T0Q5_9PSEU|nr:hypothetical protein [Saccharothrix violaceirubra]MBB4964409.1 L-aminopeptidase/D-esterase-like protein [Saccharothrix violaceirubra]